MPGRKSPYGIHVDSPDQRQWISFDSIGSIRRIASIVCGAAGSHRALKCRSPTSIRNVPIAEDSVAADAGQPGRPSAPTSSTRNVGCRRPGSGSRSIDSRSATSADPHDPGPDRWRRPRPRPARAAADGRRLSTRVRCRPRRTARSSRRSRSTCASPIPSAATTCRCCWRRISMTTYRGILRPGSADDDERVDVDARMAGRPDHDELDACARRWPTTTCRRRRPGDARSIGAGDRSGRRRRRRRPSPAARRALAGPTTRDRATGELERHRRARASSCCASPRRPPARADERPVPVP